MGAFKSIVSNLLNKHAAEKERLGFNSATSNAIEPGDVSFGAIKGHDIVISKGCYISEDSSIDSYSYIGFNTSISKTSIGRYNSIANNVNIGHGEHPLHLIPTSSLFIEKPYETLTEKDCVIEHDVWIGSGATIRRGVTLGTGAVVGANSFVNKDVPPFAVVGGVPAKIIKYRFSEEKIAEILASKWWEHELEQARLIIKQLEAGH